ncbi:MAG: MetQ/NlpA family ABC transporter substrate-binding protein [Eubacteriales bacterium]|nr:ABC transporter substrate-binding protein [Bacillota bacterium]MBV1726686.1 ABC transporter substrate-binding protein [Desulforudis sp.]MDQ7788860.1 MetQ/NlpA family ABC transporter substrate-binding protein [Clostridia bacterium]MDZ4042729.1 MetQ/NlpA family ABC transporter substrate-binding protein [Eubacteriales bacterium]MBU4533009.1 ABC transporter substrate-binding protein [Bacillota bacterium]
MKLGKRGIVSILVAGLLLLGLAGCGGSTPAGDVTPQSQPLKLGMLPITDNLPFWVAQDKGYFEDEGLTVELIDFPSALERDSALTAKAIDGALGDIIAVAQLNDGGTPLTIVSIGQGVTAEEGRFAILAAPGSGITSVEQLKGVEIATSANSIMEYLIDTVLSDAGFPNEEIAKILIPKIPVRVDALLSGTVQAAILPDPLAALAELKGARVVLDDTATDNLSQTVIYFRNEALERKANEVGGLMRAYTRAVEDIMADPTAFNEILAEKARVPHDVLQSDAHGMEIIFSAPMVPTEDMVDRVLTWMNGKGLLNKPVSYSDLVDGQVLN